jgi:NTP pyrophosphatase (non-canonical NTP hydrolase)
MKAMSDSLLTFREVSMANLVRACEWHKGGLDEWSPADWSNALAGECGEVCNAVKKLRRVEDGISQASDPRTREEAIRDIAEECADTFLYLDLLCQRLGINLDEAVVAKFNRVSEREGFPQRIGPDAEPKP